MVDFERFVSGMMYFSGVRRPIEINSPLVLRREPGRGFRIHTCVMYKSGPGHSPGCPLALKKLREDACLIDIHLHTAEDQRYGYAD